MEAWVEQPVRSRALKMSGLISVLLLQGCARQPCADSDVLAFVANQSDSRDLYAVGLAGPRGAGSASRAVIASQRTGSQAIDRHVAVCSAWILARNPAYAPGNGEPHFLRERQDFRLMKLVQGYEVTLIRRP